MSFTDGTDTTEGDPSQVIDEIDRRTVADVKYNARIRHPVNDRLEIKFAKRDHGAGASIEVESEDRGWANHVFASVSEEIQKGVPRWSWTRRAYGRLIVAVVTALCIAGTVTLIVLPHVPAKDRPELPLVVFVQVSFGLGGILGMIAFSERPYNWFAPAFEITPEGRDPSGTRRLGYAVSLAVTSHNESH